MANITKDTYVSADVNSLMRCVYVSQLIAGEDLPAVSPCYIGSDGKVYKAVSTQCTITNVADFVGVTPKLVKSGDPVTLFGKGARFNLGSGMTPGTLLWISATAGAWSDAKVATADLPLAWVISATDILVIR